MEKIGDYEENKKKDNYGVERLNVDDWKRIYRFCSKFRFSISKKYGEDFNDNDWEDYGN